MRRLPQVVAVTLLVIGTPLLMVTLLVSLFGAPVTVSWLLALVVVATVLSIGVSYLGAALWSHRAGTGDVLFADLTLWGWIGRWRQERQLASATRLLQLQEEPAEELPFQLSPTQRVQLLERLAGILEARHPDTHGHSRRVARHATAIAEQMDLPPEQVARIRTAAAVHDVGKIYVPTAVIDKDGALTDEEFDAIKEHSVFGAEMVAALGDPELTRIVRHHHERCDGTGYPDGLAGEQIPLGARIIAVADTFDAVTSERPYRAAKPHREALALLSAEAGSQLDPDAVRAFRRYYAGHRRVAFLAVALNGPRELVAALAGGLKFGSVVLATGLAALGATGVAVESQHSDRGAKEMTASPPDATQLISLPSRGQARGDTKAPTGSPHAEEGGHAVVPDEGPATEGSGGDTEPAPTESPSSDGTSGSGGGGEEAGSGMTTGAGGGPSVGVEGPPAPTTVALPDTSKAAAPVASTVDSVLETTKSATVTTPEISPVLPKVTGGLGGE